MSATFHTALREAVILTLTFTRMHQQLVHLRDSRAHRAFQRFLNSPDHAMDLIFYNVTT